jgi:hypothetical protein
MVMLCLPPDSPDYAGVRGLSIVYMHFNPMPCEEIAIFKVDDRRAQLIVQVNRRLS